MPGITSRLRGRNIVEKPFKEVRGLRRSSIRTVLSKGEVVCDVDVDVGDTGGSSIFADIGKLPAEPRLLDI